MRITIDAKLAERLEREGVLPAGSSKKKRTKAGREYVEESFSFGYGDKLVFVLPIDTASEANGRVWQARATRARNARRIVSQAFGKHLRQLAPIAEAYHRGEVVRLKLTRLGGSKLDKMANLGPALKSVEDAVAAALGANDGAANWQATAEQEPGGLVGVRVEIEVQQ